VNGEKIKITEVTVLTVADLHQSRKLYADLVKAVDEHKPDVVAIVGDCLHMGEDMEARLNVEECAAALSSFIAKMWCLCEGITRMKTGLDSRNIGVAHHGL
jgi:Icc-related predicted phosphoesterase